MGTINFEYEKLVSGMLLNGGACSIYKLLSVDVVHRFDQLILSSIFPPLAGIFNSGV